MSKHFPHIFEPFTVKRTTFRNRVVMPPMGSNYATYSGEVSEEMKDYYGLRARGGTALITVENACIDFPLATNGTKQLRIDGKQFMPGLFELTERIHKYGALASIQLNHAGASAYPERLGGLQSVSSSSVPSKEGNPAPRPLTKQEILNIVQKYADAAERAIGAGGAATAILVQAALDGVREIAVFNRRDEFFPKAEKVVAQLNEQTECKVTLYDLADHASLKRELDSSDIYIDGTSCGMKPLEGVVAIPDKSYLHKELVVMDTVYAPRQTELMRWADEVGCKNFNGLGMMLYQGAEAFKLWTGKDMPVDFIRDVLF